MNNIANLTKMSFLNLKSVFKQIAFVLVIWTAVAIYNQYFLNILFGFIILMTLYQVMVYEDMNGIDNLISVLPVKKNEYVMSRYLFGAIIILLTGIFLIVVYNIGNKINPIDIPLKAFLGMGITSAIFATSFIIPTVLKFGANKIRVFMAVAFMLMIGMVSGIMEILSKTPDILVKITNIIDATGISLILITLNIAVLIISILVSIKVYKNKEVKK
ncbi:ABC-2 transporter permease [Clostridium sp. CCUG 7971]|uniref:ABC-2 transporter permease n=1 Tax=Clostridium sp. CCUG 7971 TaxID=2811414 RepID=UPI001ABAFB2D|nr:ABC-2 transporter permease [Clostridium sp. CCUG 7971]MBO3443996.1 ABC-2 transporter permease [Clostridium sp. CCUG 7971]